MAGERRTSGERRAPTAVSVRRLETKVDQLSEDVKADREATTELGKRLNTLNLNGSAAALHRLAENSDKLLRLADVAPRLIDVADKQADLDGFWRTLKRFGNPFKPAGAVFWLVLASFVAAFAYRLVAPSGHP